jgi:DNA adenine methylase
MYAHEMSVDEHLEMLDTLKSHPGPAVISGYENAIYDQHLRRGWKRLTVKPPKVEKQALRMEVLWVKA